METLPGVLSHLSLEMCCFEIVEDMLTIWKIKENRDNLLLILLDSDSLEYDDIQVLMMTKLIDIDNECILMEKVMEIFGTLIDAPDSVLRPYQQHFITEL